MFSVNQGFEGGDACGPLLSLAFTRFQSPGLHAAPVTVSAQMTDGPTLPA